MDPPDDCNSLASGRNPSSIKLDAKELASGMHSSGSEPYGNEGGSRPPPRPMTVTPRSMTANAARSPLIDGVDDEEDRLCRASSWSLHTNRWSLCAKERGGGR